MAKYIPSPRDWVREQVELIGAEHDTQKSAGARVLRSGVMRFKLLNMKRKETRMHWSTPTLVEICIGLEINGYLPAEF